VQTTGRACDLGCDLARKLRSPQCDESTLMRSIATWVGIEAMVKAVEKPQRQCRLCKRAGLAGARALAAVGNDDRLDLRLSNALIRGASAFRQNPSHNGAERWRRSG
jgi:hypothetical protein